MMTREEILSIEEYCAEHKVSHKRGLEEMDIPFWHFYKAKKKYREEDELASLASSSSYHLSRYVLNGRYHIDNNGVENAIRPLAIGRKNYLFCGNHDAAIRASIVYALFTSCKAHDIDVRIWLEDTLKRIPTEKHIDQLLPCNWKVLPANSR